MKKRFTHLQSPEVAARRVKAIREAYRLKRLAKANAPVIAYAGEKRPPARQGDDLERQRLEVAREFIAVMRSLLGLS